MDFFGIFNHFLSTQIVKLARFARNVKWDFSKPLQNIVFKNSPKWTTFGIFNHFLSTQNVNVARFAHNVDCDFFCDFQTPCCVLPVYV